MTDRTVTFRKSSFSGGGNECVEVSNDLRSVCDSKNPGGPVLRVGDLRALLSVVTRAE